tara:strand:- start:74 stop:1204 length:1131 start_codon:yes stop_codon:yes gene_type:complete
LSNIFSINYFDKNSSARSGIIETAHGNIRTPFFMPVGTHGAVKTQSSEEISAIPSSILLSNTYHLYLRPGLEILSKAKGLHKFMNWDGAILTDSGGFQIFSLKGFRKILNDGVTFRSHIDGSEHHFTPEKIIDIQRIIGSDFMMMLDVCPPGDANYNTWLSALDKTTEWAKKCMKRFNETDSLYGYNQIIIPVVQGGIDKQLRQQSAEQLCNLEADAYAIGGLAVGESKNAMLDTVGWMDELLPKEKPRYLMGVGTPTDLVNAVLSGIDMFDCVMPTRNARNGQLFTIDGKINIRNSKYKTDFSVLDENSNSQMSNKYTKAYLHHLFKTEEILGYRIATQHNLHFYIQLMKIMQKQIKLGSILNWSRSFFKQYNKV